MNLSHASSGIFAKSSVDSTRNPDALNISTEAVEEVRETTHEVWRKELAHGHAVFSIELFCSRRQILKFSLQLVEALKLHTPSHSTLLATRDSSGHG